MRVEIGDTAPAADATAYRAVELIYHSYLTGLILCWPRAQEPRRQPAAVGALSSRLEETRPRQTPSCGGLRAAEAPPLKEASLGRSVACHLYRQPAPASFWAQKKSRAKALLGFAHVGP
jgi:hypothetical protein